MCLCDVPCMLRLRLCWWGGVEMDNTQLWHVLLIPARQEGHVINLWYWSQVLCRVVHATFPHLKLLFSFAPTLLLEGANLYI